MFETLEKSLDAYIQEITECLDFVAAGSRLRPRLREYIDWGAARGTPTQLITNFLDTKNAREQVIYRALYVSGHAAFEQFSRDLVTEAAAFISANVDSYDSLWTEFKTEHIFRTGQAMETIHQPLEHYVFDYDKLSKNIGGCISGSVSFTLNADALALIRGTLTPDNFDKIIKRLTITLNWDALASQPKVKACFQTAGTRDSANEARTFLEGMVKTRNRIAHTTDMSAEFGEPQVRDQLRFVAAFCHAMASQIRTEITKKVNACAKRR